MDPVRFRFMEALSDAPPVCRRRPRAAGPAPGRAARRLRGGPGGRGRARQPAPEPSQAPGHEARDCAADTPIDAPLPADTLASLARALDTGHAVPWRDAYPELPLLDVYRDIWAKVSANRQLRQSEQQVPDNAGPLNSNNLVHRSLALMRQLSPTICTSSCPTWTRWPGWSSSTAR